MKNPHTRWFYTAVGCMVTGDRPPSPPPGLPEPMFRALEMPAPEPFPGREYPGEGLTGNRCRRIYGAAWEILRPAGFRRPGRFEPWPGVPLLIPFFRGPVGAIPQGFSPRVPLHLRSLAVAGKAAASAALGMRLLVVCARVEPEAWAVIRAGGGVVCTPATLPQALCELDFPGGSE